ncbi:flavin-binding monooxygenase [Rhodotorula toruloides]|uniref:Flavin-binding monooxygenase n=1 Tax=Rhodotorula toruloides TaxID=5286 RepID=A0A511KA17_RHOTO|nr:flavin-binding monooxygenase [Rhodotorula toruloides]
MLHPRRVPGASTSAGERTPPDRLNFRPRSCHLGAVLLVLLPHSVLLISRTMISIDLDPLTGLPRGLDNAPFVLEDHPVGESGRKLKVAMIGAGFSGIIAGVRIDQHLKDHVELDIFEKNHSVGGTWFENNYPGLCCDIPAHCYSLTFEPNHRWTNFYASGREILAYLQRVAAKYKLERFLRFGHKLTAANWNEKTSQWHLSFDIVDEKDSKVGEKEAVVDAVIQGMGGLSRWDWPNIPGIKEFKGRLLHSAAYETKAEDEKDKTVAVIGSGSSAIQIVPALQPHAKRVDNYVRGSAWIATPFASTELLKRKPDANNYTFTEEEKERFEEDPAYYHEFRKSMEKELNAVHGVTLKGSELQTGAVAAFRELMEKKLETKPDIAKVFIPTFAVGCRRLTPGPGYLEALTSDNVDFVSTGIKRITETGIETNDGKLREYDTIVSATGFDTSFRPRVPIVGKNGSDVRDLWEDIPSSYLSMFVGPDHPNYASSGSLLVVFEKEVDYIVKCLQKMVRENIVTMAAKQEAVNDWQEYVHTYFQKTVFSTKCRSWYKRGLEEGPVTALWPGSVLHGLGTLANPRWEDFHYTRSNRNRLAWLGNGWSKTELEGGDTAYYLDEIDYPPVPQ